jgi:hypothetical protein
MTHIVGYRDGTAFAYGGVLSVTYGEGRTTFCGKHSVASISSNQILLIQVLPSNHLSAQAYPNGWSHDPHALTLS